MDKDQNTTTEDIFSWIYSIMPDQHGRDWYIELTNEKLKLDYDKKKFQDIFNSEMEKMSKE